MTITTISGLISNEVVLGNGTYGITLTVAPTGTIKSSGAYGITAPSTISNANIDNLGTISGINAGVYLGAGGTINNAGSIGGIETGVVIAHATLINSGMITGDLLVAVADGYYGSVLNGGEIRGESVGVALLAHASFNNLGTIYGTVSAVDQIGGSFSNASLISGGTYGAFSDGGVFINRAGGSIISGLDGVFIGPVTLANAASPVNATFSNYGYVAGELVGAIISDTTVTVGGNAILQTARLTNFGTIAGAGTGIFVFDGSVANTGLVESGEVGVFLLGGSFGDSGTVVAPVAVYGSNQISLYLSPGAEFSGLVEDHAGDGTLVLAGGEHGSIDLGTSFTGFSTIEFAAGSSWSLEAGSIAIADGQTITGFGFSDTIMLDHFAVNTLDTKYIAGSGLALTDTLGNHATLDIAGNFSTASFIVIDSPGGTEIELLCYLRGTRIATPAGEVAIEDLAIGEAVITRFNGYRKIKWIGRQSFGHRFIAGNFDQIPVRIMAGALGICVPRRDLFVSPGHSMLINDCLVLAKHLVNGVDVLQEPPAAQVDYFQLEFESHDCVLAEGTWSESYADTPGWRGQFHNAEAFWRLFPGHVAPAEQTLCAKRPLGGDALELLLRPLAARAASRVVPGRLHGFIETISADGEIRGWAWDESNPFLAVMLEVVVNGRRIGASLACQPRADLKAAGYGLGHCGFGFTSPVGLPVEVARVAVRRLGEGSVLRRLGGLKAA